MKLFQTLEYFKDLGHHMSFDGHTVWHHSNDDDTMIPLHYVDINNGKLEALKQAKQYLDVLLEGMKLQRGSMQKSSDEIVKLFGNLTTVQQTKVMVRLSETLRYQVEAMQDQIDD